MDDDIYIKEEPDDGPTQCSFEIVDFLTPSKNIAIWSNDETKLLIELYKDFISEIGPLKRFRLKKDMWNEIALQIPPRTSKQCEDRFKTLLRRKKKGAEKVSRKEAKRKQCDLEDVNVKAEESQITGKHIKLTTDNKTNPALFKQVQVWTNYETKLLMKLYNRLIREIGPSKRFMHKKDMWIEISTNFLNKDAKQCAERYNTILKRKKRSLIKTIYISQARKKTINFKAEDSGENSLKIRRVFSLKNYKSKLETNKSGKAAKQKKIAETNEQNEELTLNETLLQIAAKKEEGKERRHREKLEAIEKIQNIFQQIINNTKK